MGVSTLLMDVDGYVIGRHIWAHWASVCRAHWAHTIYIVTYTNGAALLNSIAFHGDRFPKISTSVSCWFPSVLVVCLL